MNEGPILALSSFLTHFLTHISREKQF